jgi:hypothetical protein
MTDYRLTFPVTALAGGVRGLKALREAQSEAAPTNALGDPRDAEGNIVVPDPDAPMGTPSPVVWYGRPGSPATSYTDLDGNVVQVPARGDPALYYVHVRSEQAVMFDPEPYDMRSSDLVDSAAVLGIWLGDEVPT